ncbi:lantibiotic dehydratase, partial [Bacillus subtilis]
MKSLKKDSLKNIEQKWFSLDSFFIRTPTLSLTFLENYLHKMINGKESYSNWVKDLINNPIFMEAIYIASPSLYENLKYWKNITDKKRKEQIAISLNNYLLRMTSRTTPFGLFSSVTVGRFENETSINIDPLVHNIKKCNPDMNWLYKLIKKLEKENSIFLELNVKFNNLVEKVGNRYFLSYNSKIDSARQNNITNDISSIIVSPPIEIIEKLTQEPLKIKNILRYLKKEYSSVTSEKILSLIHNLVDQDYLITDLRPSLLEKSPFNYVINKIKSIEKQDLQYILQELLSIQAKINYYETLPIGEGLNEVNEIEKLMSNLVVSDIYLQVNLSLNNKSEIKLSNNVKKDLIELTECLEYFSITNNKPRHLKNYLNEFIDKYGEHREVELLELLNNDIGLGSPASYKNPTSTREFIYKSNQKLENYLLRKLLNSIKENEQEIEITLEELKHLNKEKNISGQNNFVKSFEIFGNIVADNIDSFNKGKYTIFLNSENPVSNFAGKAAGRFTDLLKDKTNVKQFYDQQTICEHYINAEMSYTPNNGKIANIMMVDNFSDYEINLNNFCSEENETIPIEDIVVGVEEDLFYFKSKNLNKRINISVNSLVNMDITPNVFRFIQEASLFNDQYLTGFNWGRLIESEFLPRVKFKKTILSPAMWNFNLSDHITEKPNYDEWLKIFKRWAKKWSIPKSVYLVEGDEKLFLNLDVHLHLKILYKKIQKMKIIRLIESEINLSKSWAQDRNKNKYNIEFIFPLIQNKNNNSIGKTKKNKPIIYTNSILTKKQIGSDWLYFKLYFNSFRDEEIIADHIPSFLNQLINNNQLINKYFYVRYLDDKPHIRLRIQGDPNILLSTVLIKMKDWTSNLIEGGLINKIELSCYEREIERYGGPDFIDICETLFYYDSICVSELFNFLSYTTNELFDKETIAVLSVIFYLEEIGFDYNQQLNLFERILENNKFPKEFRLKKDYLVFLCNSNLNWSNLRKSEDG